MGAYRNTLLRNAPPVFLLRLLAGLRGCRDPNILLWDTFAELRWRDELNDLEAITTASALKYFALFASKFVKSPPSVSPSSPLGLPRLSRPPYCLSVLERSVYASLNDAWTFLMPYALDPMSIELSAGSNMASR